ncbi:transcriptional repressor [Weissella diestrammenae]|uniref:Transcriptional repressor n=1 Tax=Weissella diestrammenae TaxID=1162633 RepID=A0A7G9T5V3_9LACO|nr:Fur family transcriptional regulator [Weissella diestrammenae]MCM0582308.1 transcriptional repressor [Weissella diestrammenae]QNN75478.1 transcriptional repressor [Weissella diestrammenae]
MTENKVEAAFAAVKRSGFKLTEQRSIIVRYLVENRMVPTHPTAKAIYHDLQAVSEKISLATVYNTLDMLVNARLVLAIDNKTDGKMHYDWFGIPHYHVICTNCGKIVDADNFPLTELPKLAAEATGYKIGSYQVEVRGICPDCQRRLGNQG